MNAGAQRLCAWSGVACIALFFVGFWVVAGFIPPPSPRLTGEQLSALFTVDATRIRIGMMISLFAAALLASWAASITTQMRRMEGPHSALAYTNLAVGAIFVLEFVFSIIIWESMTYRPHQPDTLLAMNDTAWFLFVSITSTPALQALVMGIAVLSDKRAIFPRWVGYFDLWVVLLFMPGTIAVFFSDGPFAWNGFLTWYLPLGVFAIWMITNSAMVLRAVAAGDGRSDPVFRDDAERDREIARIALELRRLGSSRPDAAADRPG
jgi:hypothetical protein